MTESLFSVAVFLSVVNRALIEYLKAPVAKKYPKLDLWWLVYVSFVTGGVISWFAGVNLFADIGTMSPLLGRALTAACVGGGSNLLHEIAKRRNDALPAIEAPGGFSLAHERRIEDIIREGNE